MSYDCTRCASVLRCLTELKAQLEGMREKCEVAVELLQIT